MKQRILFYVLTLALLLSACGSPATATQVPAMPTDMAMASPTPNITHTQYPVTITDCDGRQITFEKAPARVVTFDPAVTEIMLVLGLKDRIAGVTLFDDGPSAGDKMWSVTRADMLSLTVINDPKAGYPAKEKVVSIKPDLVASEYPSAFDESYGIATIDQFAQLGIPAYLTHGGCGETKVWNDFSVLYQDLRDFGIIFDVQERAEAEIAKLQGQVEALQQKLKDAHVPDYSIGTHCCGSESVGSLGTTTANAIITLAGSHYTFADVDTGQNPISWEIFIDRDPDVIWLITGLGMTADEIQQMLENDPRTAGMSAVKNKRYVRVAYDDVGESPRIIDGLTSLVEDLIALSGQPVSMKTQYPVTITDCDGRQTTYDKAPERVVTIDPSVTEILLTLGLKDKIVGYTEFYSEDHQWPATKTEMAALNQINDINVGYPSQEAIVAVSPDFVTSVYPWAFGYGLPERDGWTQLGVNSYETLGGCASETLTDFSILYQDMRNLGIIFDVQERAEAEIAKLQARVEALQAKVKEAVLASKRVVIYDSTTENPPVYGGTINAVIKLAGAEYIWEKLPANTTPSWEDFVAANPDVIWIIPDSGPTADELIQQIENDPRLKELAAVKNKAYIIVPQADATIESPRLVDGLEQVINALLALK